MAVVFNIWEQARDSLRLSNRIRLYNQTHRAGHLRQRDNVLNHLSFVAVLLITFLNLGLDPERVKIIALLHVT